LKKVALLFAGQGAQYVGMGRDLSQAHSAAKALFDEAGQFLGPDFLTACFEGPAETLTQTKYCQPALYVHGLALLALVRDAVPSLKPAAMAGLSLGEFTAHAAAGTFSFSEGLKLVAARGRLMQEACESTQGGMVTLLGATPDQAAQVAAGSGLQVANLNCPGQIVLSGASDLIPKAVEVGQSLGLKKVIPLKVAGAYHSRLMQSAQDGLRPFLATTTFHTPSVPVLSNVTGAPTQGTDAIQQTLLDQVTGSVRWEDCIRALIASGTTHFLELGPGKVLAGLNKRIDSTVPFISIGTLDDFNASLPALQELAS
jgi:[acyl-carrier-protein] S-malonyltransferase